MIQGVITQGTTPELTFSLPIEAELIAHIRASFSQKDKEVLLKDEEQCVIDLTEDAIIIQLSQEDTYLFDERKGRVTVRIRILSENGKVVITDDVYLRVKNISDKVVMINEP